MQQTETPETIADLLADYRTSKIAQACGTHRTTVSRWRAGAVPDEGHVAAIAALVRVSEARVRRALLATSANAL